ncbi:hypothetical protein V5799_021616 [Amblyomma americanum]|uniref:Uncharacterized protein n=1 Tax=Amblyomma americanum TaxID=6943 RepID=A0AAQ4FMX2_AMBAM
MEAESAAAVATAALVMLELLEEPPAKKPRMSWVSPWLQRRKQQGAYENLMRELALEDSENYRRWIRMYTATFEELLGEVRPHITKKDTPFREAIQAGERLAIILRYLATGNSEMVLQFAFYVAHNTISGIISEVSQAIYRVLKPKVLKCHPEETHNDPDVTYEQCQDIYRRRTVMDTSHCLEVHIRIH